MANKPQIPFANIPRSKAEALLLDTPNLKVLATVKSVIEQVFAEFLSKQGKYRRYIDSFPFASGYATDADPGRGETLIHFRVLTQEMEKVTPSIQVILGQPVPVDDLTPGYEQGRFAHRQAKACQRHYYTINAMMVVAGHSGTIASELGIIANTIVTRYIPQVFSGVIFSSELNWQLCFPRHLEVSDQIQRREEIRASAPEQIHYNEWTMQLIFEELVLVGNPLAEIEGVVQYAHEIPADPYWEGPDTILLGIPTAFTLNGRKDAQPEAVGVTDPAIARVRGTAPWVYEVIGLRPGKIELQSLYPVGTPWHDRPAVQSITVVRR